MQNSEQKTNQVQQPALQKAGVVGRWARLIQLPDGYTSSAYNLTVGDCYLIEDVEGSNVWLFTEEGLVSIWRGRVEIL